MEADWEIEIGPGAPVIEANWSEFVDLRRSPELAAQLAEAGNFPGLSEALVQLNGRASPVWTAKCDVWPMLDRHEFDAYEMDALPERSVHAWGCYIDLLPKSREQWNAPEITVSWCKSVCQFLHAVPLPGSRVDMIVRRAEITPGSADIGITVYMSSCGVTLKEAHQRLPGVLERLVDAVMRAGALTTLK